MLSSWTPNNQKPLSSLNRAKIIRTIMMGNGAVELRFGPNYCSDRTIGVLDVESDPADPRIFGPSLFYVYDICNPLGCDIGPSLLEVLIHYISRKQQLPCTRLSPQIKYPPSLFYLALTSNINLTPPTTQVEVFPHQPAPAESQINPSQPTILSELTDPLTRQLQVLTISESTKTERPGVQDFVLNPSLGRCRDSSTQTDHSRFCHSRLRRSHDSIQGP